MQGVSSAPSHKMAAIYSLAQRAYTHCSEPHLRQDELNYIFRLFKSNGFPTSSVNCALAKIRSKFEENAKETSDAACLALTMTQPLDHKIVVSVPYVGGLYHILRRKAQKFGITLVPKTTKTVRAVISHPKTPVPEKQKSGVVYCVECSCGSLYIGQTDREVQTRVKEHETQWNLSKGAFSEHVGPLHNPSFINFRLLAFEKHNEIREVKEAFLIAQAGEDCIQNLNIGARSAVNRNRGRNLNENYALIISRFPNLNTQPCQSVQKEEQCRL